MTKPIWFRPYTITEINDRGRGLLTDHMGIEFTDITDNALIARMPVDDRTRQPVGILHGGASCVLAETLGSVAARMCLDDTVFYPVGLEINANHIRSVRNGFVTGTCIPVHIGRSTHIWNIEIREDATDKLTCVSRLTVAILKKELT
jgi:1,4-dihydroxy-2-naphthoyl-CoA hydrolase